jgi:hypothetical protein
MLSDSPLIVSGSVYFYFENLLAAWLSACLPRDLSLPKDIVDVEFILASDIRMVTLAIMSSSNFIFNSF